MSKTNTRFKEAFNQCLEFIGKCPLGEDLPGEVDLAKRLNVSRTIVRSILTLLNEKDVIRWHGRQKTILRLPSDHDYFPDDEVSSASEKVESSFLEWILRGDVEPGTTLNELELARQFQVSTSTVREFLISFGRFGLIEKSPRHKWVLKGFTREYALELSEIRNMFELKAARIFSTLDDQHSVWKILDKIEADHHALLDKIDENYHDFSHLDERFHATINQVANNRFIDDFHNLISLIFHYHYQWNKRDEKDRNIRAIEEHLDYIHALRSRDESLIQKTALTHLTTARETLLRSLQEDQIG